MNAALAVVCAAAAASALTTPTPASRLPAEPPRRAARGPVPHPLAAMLAGVASAVVVGGLPGVILGAVTVVAVFGLLRGLPTRSERERRARLIADLPLALDLLGGCLAAGLPPTTALGVVAAATDGPVRDELELLHRRRILGATSSSGAASEVGVLVTALDRADESGVPLADLLRAASTEARQAAATRRAVAVRRAGVAATLPLGLCFLPAFVLTAVVPVAASLVTGLSLVR